MQRSREDDPKPRAKRYKARPKMMAHLAGNARLLNKAIKHDLANSVSFETLTEYICNHETYRVGFNRMVNVLSKTEFDAPTRCGLITLVANIICSMMSGRGGIYWPLDLGLMLQKVHVHFPTETNIFVETLIKNKLCERAMEICGDNHHEQHFWKIVEDCNVDKLDRDARANFHMLMPRILCMYFPLFKHGVTTIKTRMMMDKFRTKIKLNKTAFHDICILTLN